MVVNASSPALCVTSVNPGGPGEVVLAALDTREVPAGTVVRLQQTGGSGFGDPFERDTARVLRDVRDGYLSTAAAETRYGVVIVGGEVDRAATAERRKR